MRYRIAWLRRVVGLDIGADCVVSFKARLDRTSPRRIHIGDHSGIALGATILSHNFTLNESNDTTIGRCCMIGANAIIAPGVTIGNGCIIGPGAVVLIDVPDGSVAVGNPARIVERGIRVGKWGIRLDRIPPERIDPDVIVETEWTK